MKIVDLFRTHGISDVTFYKWRSKYAMSVSAFYDPNPEDLDHIIGLSQKLLAEDLTRLYKEDLYTFTERMKRKRNEIYVNI